MSGRPGWCFAVNLSTYAVQLIQVLTVLLLAPLLSGAIARFEARLQGRRGPRVLQPYYDLWKLFTKETLRPNGSSTLFIAGPVVAFCCYLIVPMLIPVLTSFPLPLGYMGDILGGGFILGLGSFAVALSAADTQSPYAQLGSSRAMSFGALGEPIVLFVVFSVGVITRTDLPYAMAATIRSSGSAMLAPAHVLAAIAFFLVVLSETGRIPVETHSGTLELGMIDEARAFEHSGPAMALLTWGSAMKQMILYTILINVFVAPWGLASSTSAMAVLLAVLSLLGKALVLGCVFAVVDDSFAKLRLFKITEYLAGSFLIAVLALLVYLVGVG